MSQPCGGIEISAIHPKVSCDNIQPENTEDKKTSPVHASQPICQPALNTSTNTLIQLSLDASAMTTLVQWVNSLWRSNTDASTDIATGAPHRTGPQPISSISEFLVSPSPLDDLFVTFNATRPLVRPLFTFGWAGLWREKGEDMEMGGQRVEHGEEREMDLLQKSVGRDRDEEQGKETENGGDLGMQRLGT